MPRVPRRFGPLSGLVLGALLLAGCGAQPSAVNVPQTGTGAPLSSQTSSASKAATAPSRTYVVGGQNYAGQANLRQYKKAAAAHPTDYLAQIAAGVSSFVNGDYSSAIAYYQKAANLQPHNGEPLNNIGNVYFRGLNRPKLALPYYERATHVQPDYVYGWWNLALCEKALGNMAAAKAAVIEGLKNVPRNDPNYNSLKMALAPSK